MVGVSAVFGLFVPLVRQHAETAQCFLRETVDGDVDDGIGNRTQAGHIGRAVDIVNRIVLRVHIDDDDMPRPVCPYLFAERIAVKFGHIEQAAQAEVVGQTAVEQVDIRPLFAVLISRHALPQHFQTGLQLQLVGGKIIHHRATDFFRQAVAAIAAVVVQRQRCEHQRHGTGSGHGTGDFQIRKVQTHHIEIFLRELETVAQRHIRGGNHRKRPFAARSQIAESSVFKQSALKLLLQQVASAELGRCQARHIRQRKNLFRYLPLEILLQKTAFERRNRFLAVQRKISRQHRTARHAVYQIHRFQQAFLPSAAVNFLLVQLFQHTVAQSRRARTAAGEHQHHQHIVVLGFARLGIETVTLRTVHLINGRHRLILKLGAGRQTGQSRQQHRLFQTAEKTSSHKNILSILSDGLLTHSGRLNAKLQ